MASLIIVLNNFVGYNFISYGRCCRNDFRIGLINKLILWNFHDIENRNVNISENPIYPTNERVY